MSSCRIPEPSQFSIVSARSRQCFVPKPASYFHSELGYFSIDHERFFFLDKSKLGTLDLPQDCKQLDINLNVGFEKWENLPNVQQHLDSILHWILLNKKQMTIADLGLNVDFVTSRGNLARVLNVFSSKDSKGWTMLAARYRGTVYLSHIEPDRDEKDQTPFGRRVCYWGKRFEMEVTKQDRDTISETVKLGPIRAYPGFFSVVRLQLEDHTIVLRAEVDAQMLGQGEERSEYVELKVTTETIVRAKWAFKQKRLVPWWCQSVVAGTPLIVYGIRDYDGHVKSIEGIRTDEIPDYVGLENLDKDKYLMFLNDILSWIKKDVCVEEDGFEYLIQWDPNVPGVVTATVLPCGADNTLLRDWYVSEMEDHYARVKQQQRSQPPRASTPRDHRSSFLPNAGHKEHGLLSETDWIRLDETNEGKEHEIKMERMNRRLEESWPRGTTPEVQPPEASRLHHDSRTEEPCLNAEEWNMRAHEMSRPREAGAQYRQSRSSDDQARNPLKSVDRCSWSRGDALKREERTKEYLKPWQEDRQRKRRISPSTSDGRTKNDQRSSRFRSPPSPYSHGSRRDALDDTRTTIAHKGQGHRLQSRGQYQNFRSSRFSNRTTSPSYNNHPLSETKAKRFKRDEEHDGRRSRRQVSRRSGLRTKTA